MSQFQFEPLHPLFGARVAGIDLTAPMTDDDIGSINAAMDEYSLLVFPDQDMTDEAQLALTKRLGSGSPRRLVRLARLISLPR